LPRCHRWRTVGPLKSTHKHIESEREQRQRDMKRRSDVPPSWNEISVIFYMFRGRKETRATLATQNGDTTIKERRK
jgi:hypothetical protein